MRAEAAGRERGANPAGDADATARGVDADGTEPRLDADLCYRALRTRDRRFDGRFFVAVRSTGVFCRPICPARTPLRENCWFVPSAAAAREAGFRPCLRCRPEAAPGTPAWQGTSATVGRALRLIHAGGLDDGDVEGLAARLGVGARHLRRLFARHVGASPRAVAQTRRVLFAKKLIDETTLPMVEVATAAGYTSVRRFNEAVRRTYGRAPRELRRAHPRAGDAPDLTLRLSLRPPLAWKALLAFLARRAIPGVESIVDGVYRRTLAIDGVPGHVAVRRGDETSLAATVALRAPAPLVAVVERLRRLFDLEADPGPIAAHLAGDPLLAPAVAAHPGLRVPGAWDGFELAVRAVLGQQVSVRGATTLAGRLAERFGEPCPGDPSGGLDRLFPRPERLARARVETIGLPRTRADAIRALARAVADGALVLDGSADPQATREALRALPGVGDWTAAYVAMRALREPDAFPAGDLVLRRAVSRGGGTASAREVAARAEAWRPWRAYAALYLWQRASDAAAPSHDAGAPSPALEAPSPAPSRASRARLRSAPKA
jgi:AraC family transcriptional regulator of adaptative response / DNA-3-methyladenine glycosylase II